MKISKILEAVGITATFIGGAAMDSQSIIIPLIMAFGGLGIALAGAQIEGLWHGEN